ncbi:MAG: site-2 protease family protein [Nitrososphaera sp.]
MLPQKGQVRVQSIKNIIFLVHTPYGLKFFDRVAKSPIAHAYAKFNIYTMPLITVMAIFLIVGSVAVIFSSSLVRQDVRTIGPQANLLIPVLNPYIPLVEGWIALVVTMLIHEAGHGIVARVYNIRVDSTGIVLFLGIPVGAFVNIDREELKRVKLSQKSAVLTAGPMNNMILAGISLIGLYLVTSTLIPVPLNSASPTYGVVVIQVNKDQLAYNLGMTNSSVIQQVGNQKVQSFQDLSDSLHQNLGRTVQIQWVDGNGIQHTKNAQLPAESDPSKGILGVMVSQLPQKVLDDYKSLFTTNPLRLLVPPTMNQGIAPFSPELASKFTSPTLGAAFVPLSNLFFWMWFINFNVGIFNALPIGPLDGGQLYGFFIESRARSEAMANTVKSLVGYAILGILAASFAVPYLLR